jgi:hypothetical protein
VDVLEGGIELEGARLDLVGDRFEAGEQRVEVGPLEQAPLLQHPGVGGGEADVVPCERAIEVDRRREALHRLVRPFAETTAPGLADRGRRPDPLRVVAHGGNSRREREGPQARRDRRRVFC